MISIKTSSQATIFSLLLLFSATSAKANNPNNPNSNPPTSSESSVLCCRMPFLMPTTVEPRGKMTLNNVELQRGFDPETGKIVLVIEYLVYPGSFYENDSTISVWVKLNGQEAQFEMQRVDDRTPGATPRFFAQLSNQDYDCHPQRARGPSPCSKPTRVMKSLFAWASRPEKDMPAGRLNAWDLELAFVNVSGQWDNQDGSNYHFRFAE
jgi:hypothetical protein